MDELGEAYPEFDDYYKALEEIKPMPFVFQRIQIRTMIIPRRHYWQTATYS